jgi:hypothetical protein
MSILIDFKNIRQVRQENNDKIVYNSVISNDKKLFYKSINKAKFDKILKTSSFEDFWNQCLTNDMYLSLSSMYLSKLSSRQGQKDEIEQINICNSTCAVYGVNISKLKINEYIPIKEKGIILSRNEILKLGIHKNKCLKSFDAKITGKISGFISAKVSFGEGGHQDNVFEEMDVISEWWNTHMNSSCEYLILLIDTDLEHKIQSLKEKYNCSNNIKIFNHYELQEYVISLK